MWVRSRPEARRGGFICTSSELGSDHQLQMLLPTDAARQSSSHDSGGHKGGAFSVHLEAFEAPD